MKVYATLTLSVSNTVLPSNRTHLVLARCLYAGVLMHLLLVMSNSSLCDRANIALLRVGGARVVWGQHGGRGSYHGADVVVHGLRLGLLHNILERRAGCGYGRCGIGEWDRGMLEEVVVVVGSGSHDWAGLWRREVSLMVR